MRNHGDSDHFDEMSYKEMAKDIIRYADNQNIEKFTVLGHSMGAKTAMTLSMLYPERMDGVIVVDAPPKNIRKEEGEVSKLVKIRFTFLLVEWTKKIRGFKGHVKNPSSNNDKYKISKCNSTFLIQ